MDNTKVQKKGGSVLTEQQIKNFHDEGYLVIRGFWEQEQVQQAREAMNSMLQQIDLMSEDASVFTTSEQTRTSGDYFLGSGGTVRYFWEEKACDAEGRLLAGQDRTKCINKVGHALHDMDPVFRGLSYDPRVGCIARQLGMNAPLACQSMYIFKQPRIGSEVKCHQDGTFLRTEPQSVIGFWWALDDCSLENGCLWALPGSQKEGVKRHFRRKISGLGCEFHPSEEEKWDESDAKPLVIPAGTLVLLHNAVAHLSRENESENSRHAYSLHVIDGSAEYPPSNWLQREEPFRLIPTL